VYPANSLPAILECYAARVARAEIDIAMLADTDFLVVHDLNLAHATDGTGYSHDTTRAQARQLHLRDRAGLSGLRPALLSEVVAAVSAQAYPTLLELDLKDVMPWPWRRVEELAEMVQPVRDRVTFGGEADWNLRRLQVIDPALRLGFTIPEYGEWRSTRDRLRTRLLALLDLVPTAREIHVNLEDALQLRADGLSNLAEVVHGRGQLLDAWTVNADTATWRERLDAALTLGVDMITTESPRELVAAALDTIKPTAGGER
jgi:glycerophosphoryl diester phosphodiesterase